MPMISEDLERIRHSCAHLLAEAVRERFGAEGPVHFAGGPPIADGFYYDFGLPRPLSEVDIAWLESRLKELIRRGVAFERREIDAPEAKSLFADQPYKLDILERIINGEADPECGSVLSVYSHADFTDLCTGPHVARSDDIDAEAVKLLSIAGAHWRGEEGRPMLQRIYGTAWRSRAELDDFLARRAEAEARDHRKLGRELGLFFFHPTAPGMPYWLPKGLSVLNELIAFWREEHAARGYHEIASPLLNEKRLWETSGHWEHYHNDMFLCEAGENRVFGLKPMNCPNAMIVFNHEQRSWRDLPFRLSDCDVLHRKERSGTLHGLMRAQKFQQDDAHIFVAEEQLDAEFDDILGLISRFYGIFVLEWSLRLSTRPREFMGEAATWDAAEASLASVLRRHLGEGGYEIGAGEGAFYGPKIDILVKDALGRSWQMGTMQLDFQLPRRFHCAYVDKDGKKKVPVVIHRVIYGSLERFLGVLLEHTGGDLPFWLAPVQARIVPVDGRHEPAAEKLRKDARMLGLRFEIASADASLSARVRGAEVDKIPYTLVIGDREASGGSVSVRARRGKSTGAEPVGDVLARFAELSRSRG